MPLLLLPRHLPPPRCKPESTFEIPPFISEKLTQYILKCKILTVSNETESGSPPSPSSQDGFTPGTLPHLPVSHGDPLSAPHEEEDLLTPPAVSPAAVFAYFEDEEEPPNDHVVANGVAGLGNGGGNGGSVGNGEPLVPVHVNVMITGPPEAARKEPASAAPTTGSTTGATGATSYSNAAAALAAAAAALQSRLSQPAENDDFRTIFGHSRGASLADESEEDMLTSSSKGPQYYLFGKYSFFWKNSFFGV